MNFDTTSVFAAIAAATLLVLAANGMMSALEAMLMRWRPPIQSMMES
jgi:ABC-type nitrate/sulfonate/bicarbonate transport system permease component